MSGFGKKKKKAHHVEHGSPKESDGGWFDIGFFNDFFHYPAEFLGVDLARWQRFAKPKGSVRVGQEDLPQLLALDHDGS